MEVLPHDTLNFGSNEPLEERCLLDGRSHAERRRDKFLALRKKVHNFMEDPSSSTGAFVMSICSISLIFLSSVTCCLETVPSLNRHGYPSDAFFWNELDAIISILFTMELALRMFSTPETMFTFVTDKMNVVEALSVLPFWLHLFVANAHLNVKFLRAFRLVRVFRIFKFAEGSMQVRLIQVAMKETKQTMRLLGVILTLGVFVFAALIWYVERGVWRRATSCYIRPEAETEGCSLFQSIPDCFYWAVTTMTTVGYGDMTPLGMTGRCVSSAAMIGGILVIAMPVSVLGTQFQESYLAEMDHQLLSKFYKPALPHEARELDGNKLESLRYELNDVKALLEEILPEVREILRESQVSPAPDAHNLSQRSQQTLRQHDQLRASTMMSIFDSIESTVSEELATLIMIVDDFADELAESQHLASATQSSSHRTAPLNVSVPPGVVMGPEGL